jgi:hypothetical protein
VSKNNLHAIDRRDKDPEEKWVKGESHFCQACKAYVTSAGPCPDRARLWDGEKGAKS